MNKKQGVAHVARVFDKCSEWINQDLKEYRDALLLCTDQQKSANEWEAVDYYNLALEGVIHRMETIMDGLKAEATLMKAIDILSSNDDDNELVTN